MASLPIGRTREQEISLGMIVLGLIFSSMLYGVMLTQTYKYYQRFRRDPFFIKLLVFLVWLLNTLSMFFVGHSSWYYLVTNGPRNIFTWSLNVELALSVMLSGISESFLAFRVYRLSGGKYWLTTILLSLALMHFVSGQVAAIKLLLLNSSARFSSMMVPSVLRLSSAATCDTAIAVSLTYFLDKKRTGFKRSDEIINYLILFSINSGLATSMISVASLVTYLVDPKLMMYTALCFLISRVYANTFLCSLNSRQILLDVEKEKESEVSSNAPRFRLKCHASTGPGIWTSAGRSKSSTQIDVFVVTETITDSLHTPEMPVAMVRNSSTHLKEISEIESG